MKVEDQLTLIISKLDEQTKGINEGNCRINEVQVSIDDLRAAKDDFEHWRPQVDSKVADLSPVLDSLRPQVDALKFASPLPQPVVGEGSVFIKSPRSAHLDLSCS
jgi:hypothetical protein